MSGSVTGQCRLYRFGLLLRTGVGLNELIEVGIPACRLPTTYEKNQRKGEHRRKH